MQFPAALVGILLIATKGAATLEAAEQGDAQCTGSACSDEAVRVSSLLQKSRSQLGSAIIEEDPMTEEMAADMVMKELEQASEKNMMGLKGSMAATKQLLALDEAEAEAAVHEEMEEYEESTAALPFTVPFDTSTYKGKVQVTSRRGGFLTGAVAYYGIDDSNIYIGMACNSGFVGFGLNFKSPSMRNADIVICREYKAGSGQITAQDFFAKHNAMPQPDKKEDWDTLKGGRVQSGGRSVNWCQIKRARETCEPQKDYQAFDKDATLFGLLAYSQPSAVNDLLAYHGPQQKKIFPLVLSGGSAGGGSAATGGSIMTLKSPTVNVPSAAGSYMCSYHILPLPNKNKNYHIVQWRAIWDKTSPAYTAGVQHHVDLNACATPPPGVRNGQNFPCTKGMVYCSEAFLTGVNQYGPKGEVLDADAGIAVGASDTLHVMMSRHFYNPMGKGGVTDKNCQFKITYTDKLRANNFLMLLMTTTHIKVPAKNLDFNCQTLCPAECTQRLLGATEIRNVGFHLHGAGKGSILRIVRDGHELEPIASVIPWDASASDTRVKRYIFPGDQLIYECHYTNPSKRPIPYGESLTDEMCVNTMSVVGPGSMKMCADLPWGVDKIPAGCWTVKKGKKKLRSWPHCKKNIPMTYCPDKDNGKGKGTPTRITKASHEMKFKPLKYGKKEKCKANQGTYVPPVAGSCTAPPIYSKTASSSQKIPASDRSDQSNNDKTSTPPGPGQIAGEEDIIDQGGQLFKVSWLTDCNKKTIKFEVECNGNAHWLGFGMLDGGTSDTPLLKPPSMSALDVVQATMAGGATIKDGWGSGYRPPDTKKNPVAKLIKAETKNGKNFFEFERPFVNSDGITLKENGFVYLVGAINFAGGGFEAKHNMARAFMTKVSLFGGHSDYYKTEGGTAAKSKPEPEPESEPEVKMMDSGLCKEATPAIKDCWAAAANKNIMFRGSKVIKNRHFAFGCLWNPLGKAKVLLFNKEKSNKPCKSTFKCLCKTTYSEPEPEPESEGTEPYLLRSGKCDLKFMESPDVCAAKAAQASKLPLKKLAQFKNTKWPAGCFLTAKGKPFYNSFLDSMVSCGRIGTKGCVCEGPIQLKLVTHPYKLDHDLCPAGDTPITEDECEQKVKDLKLKTIKYIRFANNGFPPGCIHWGSNKAAFNRNPNAKGKFNKKKVGICQGPWTKSKQLCKHRLLTLDDCKKAAEAVDRKFSEAKVLPAGLATKWPKGCFWFNNKVWLNSGTGAKDCFKGDCLCKDR